MSIYLRKPQKLELLKVLEEEGYGSQSSAAKALAQRGYYNNYQTAVSHLNQAMRGKRPVSDRLADALLRICNYDRRLSFLKPAPKKRGVAKAEQAEKSPGLLENLSKSEKNPWKHLLYDFLGRLERGFDSATPAARLAALNDLEGIINKYKAQPKSGLQPLSSGSSGVRVEAQLAEAAKVIEDAVDIDKMRRSGVPVLKGTRFPIASILTELAEGRSVDEIAKDYDLPKGRIKKALQGFAYYFDRPFVS